MYFEHSETKEKYTMLDSFKDWKELKNDKTMNGVIPETFTEEYEAEIEWTYRDVNDMEIIGLTPAETVRLIDRLCKRINEKRAEREAENND